MLDSLVIGTILGQSQTTSSARPSNKGSAQMQPLAFFASLVMTCCVAADIHAASDSGDRPNVVVILAMTWAMAT